MRFIRGTRSKEWRARLLEPISLEALEVLRCPTAPYSEFRVIAFVRAWATSHGWNVREDKVGNLAVTVPGQRKGLAAVAFLAHLDHPAMTVRALMKETGVRADFFGGHPAERMLGASVKLHSLDGLTRPIKAKVVANPPRLIAFNDVIISRSTISKTVLFMILILSKSNFGKLTSLKEFSSYHNDPPK